jgi:hypothetical protein
MRLRVILFGASTFLLILTLAIFTSSPVNAGRSSGGDADAATPSALHDDLQRSYRTDKYLEVAESGAARGENAGPATTNISRPLPPSKAYLSAQR